MGDECFVSALEIPVEGVDRRVGEIEIRMANRPVIVALTLKQKRNSRPAFKFLHRANIAENIKITGTCPNIMGKCQPLADGGWQRSSEPGFDRADFLRSSANVTERSGMPAIRKLPNQSPPFFPAIGYAV